MKTELKPHITEKSYQAIENASGHVYTFKVPVALSKDQIKAFAERQYKVTVEDVRTIRQVGKARRFRNMPGSTSAYKKAIVRLKKGDRIAAFDVESSAEPKE